MARGMDRARMGGMAALAVALLVLACARPAEPPPPGTPRLVLLVVVDQMRGDSLERFDRFWQGGLRYLLDRGVRFTDAHHDHAITETAPGHATLATGCFPSRHGVFSNYWVDRETGEEVYSAEDDDDLVTPVRLECDSLGDWMKARYPTARSFSIAGKDRSAVLEGGLHADGAFYYDDDDGEWETSEHYYRKEPAWLKDFNKKRWLDRRFGRPWKPLAASDEDLAAVGVAPFDLGPLEPDFPIAFGGLDLAPGSAFYQALYRSPFLDEFMERFAEHLIAAETLGGDDVPDFLALGFSGTDSVGHAFGPDSPQALDALRRVDAALGRLFEFLDRRVGLDHVVIALSSDHGAVSVPEVRQAQGLAGRRVAADDVLCAQGVYERLQGRFGEGAWLLPGPFVNPKQLRETGVDYETVERAAAEMLSSCSWVSRVWTRTELSDPATAMDPMGRLFVHSFPPERGPDLLVQAKEFFLDYATGASSHGTAWPYDTHVPLLVAAPGVAPRSRDGRVRTVDLAPTLADLVDAPPTGEIDGVPLGLSRP